VLRIIYDQYYIAGINNSNRIDNSLLQKVNSKLEFQTTGISEDIQCGP